MADPDWPKSQFLSSSYWSADMWNDVSRMFRAPNLAVLSTHGDSQAILSTVVWVDFQESCIVVNTSAHRAKYRNLRKNSQCNVTAWVASDTSSYLSAQCVADRFELGAAASAHIDRLSNLYNGRNYGGDHGHRVMIWLAPRAACLRRKG